MTTVTEANRKASARSFAALVRRAPVAVEFSKVPGITHYCTGDGLSVKSIPGKNGIDDGYTGAIRVPWYLFNFTAKTYTEPFGTVTPNEIERGTVTIAGEERAILNVKLNSLATIIEIKLAGLQDG